MKLIASTLVCMFFVGCSADNKTDASVPAPRPDAKKFIGLEIGAPSPLPECARYSPDGDYQVASLQPVTPCSLLLEDEVVAIDGVEIKRSPDFPSKIAILFRAEQVPAGIDTRAAGIIQAGKLAEVVVEQSDDASYEDKKSFIPLLNKKYGPIAGFTSDRNVYWHQPNMDVIYYAAAMPAKVRIGARSTSYREWLQRSAPAPQQPGTF
ncbi:hypothetical protein D0A35_18915 [Xanthomonas campestris]|nr:hypothetical protein D0A35_18915 [Xanthomonas campestris]